MTDTPTPEALRGVLDGVREFSQRRELRKGILPAFAKEPREFLSQESSKLRDALAMHLASEVQVHSLDAGATDRLTATLYVITPEAVATLRRLASPDADSGEEGDV